MNEFESAVLKITNEPEYIIFNIYESNDLIVFSIKNIGPSGAWSLEADMSEGIWEAVFTFGDMYLENIEVIAAFIDNDALKQLDTIARGAESANNDVPKRVLIYLAEVLKQDNTVIDIVDFLKKENKK